MVAGQELWLGGSLAPGTDVLGLWCELKIQASLTGSFSRMGLGKAESTSDTLGALPWEAWSPRSA